MTRGRMVVQTLIARRWQGSQAGMRATGLDSLAVGPAEWPKDLAGRAADDAVPGGELDLDRLGVVLPACAHRDVGHHAGLVIDRRVRLAGRLRPEGALVARQAGLRVDPRAGAAGRTSLCPAQMPLNRSVDGY
jgi:hypothetical protein